MPMPFSSGTTISEQMVTAIVQLNDGDTAMRLYDFEPHTFSQAGDCALFMVLLCTRACR